MPREPTRDQLLAMAFVDGELDESARRSFQERWRREPALVKEVAALKGLTRLAQESLRSDLLRGGENLARLRVSGGGAFDVRSTSR